MARNVGRQTGGGSSGGTGVYLLQTRAETTGMGQSGGLILLGWRFLPSRQVWLRLATSDLRATKGQTRVQTGFITASEGRAKYVV
jgi:hypothetical protein